MNKIMHHPNGIYIGKTQITECCDVSAIYKTKVIGDIQVNALGLQGDEQGELSVHGGVDRAICHYPREHYEYWRLKYPHQSELFMPALFGENLSTVGMTEDNVHMGDIYQWGTALIQVTQPRSPCYKVSKRTDILDLANEMQSIGKMGWLYRVIAQGIVNDQDPLILLSRHSELSVADVIKIAFHEPFNESRVRYLLSSAGLSTSWTRTMSRRLLTKTIESFDRRLYGDH